ncbi:MAG: hypothetical protein QW835_06285 [Candidatus Hadarchaeum sp.]
MENISWNVKYKPRTIDEMVLNEEERGIVERWLRAGAIDGNVLLVSGPGRGKTSLADILIGALAEKDGFFRICPTDPEETFERFRVFLSTRSETKKLVLIEGIDRFPQDFYGKLRDSILDLDHVVFLASADSIARIPKAVESRFAYKIHFDDIPLEKTVARLSHILDKEGAEYDPQQLREFVQKYFSHSLRDLINYLQQTYAAKGKVEFETPLRTFENEDRLVFLVIEALKKFSKLNSENRRVVLLAPFGSGIGMECREIDRITTMRGINFDYVYLKLIREIVILPVRHILARYHEENDKRKYPDIHFFAAFFEVLRCIGELF